MLLTASREASAAACPDVWVVLARPLAPRPLRPRETFTLPSHGSRCIFIFPQLPQKVHVVLRGFRDLGPASAEMFCWHF